MAMSYDGMNGSDMDTSDSRKRPLDVESESGVTKRSNQGGVENIHMKILVPSVAAGAIIGKGGETIAQVQKDAGARVKMSKANDFYPATTERVCLIMGSVDSVRKVHNFIMEKIREKPDPNPKLDGEAKSNFERHKQVKILVPNSTAGMIIGKGGNFIKQIKEESGAYVQISQKSKETNLPERCVTVAGDMESNKKAVELILQKIVEDPQSGSCPNISYADYTGPVASANPTGSPFANIASQYNQNRGMELGMAASNLPNNFNASNFTGASIAGFSGMNANNGAFGLNNSIGSGMTNLNLNSAMSGSMSSSALDNLKATLRNQGYSEQATDEISLAMNTLASYGILGMGLGIGNVGPMSNLSNLGASNTSLGNLNLGASPLGPTSIISNTTTNTNSSVSSSFLGTTTATGTGGSLFGPVGSGSSGLGSSGSTGASSSLFGNSSPSLQGSDRFGGSPMLNDSFGSSNYTSPTGLPNTCAGFGSERSPSVSVNLNQNSFGLGTAIASPYAASAEEKSSVASKREIEVAENIVGAILGPGGKGIVELQQLTSTNIQISKKGVWVPGTRNRVVTITGSANSIGQAHYLINQRIQQEEVKRARQGATR
ncbi:RNA-binding protein Nova-1-like isoform X2 [Liolophura sinensis]|uniref:RNA-binding protein Nova-1-like isoform X2 n=1 Tax=Liolophura sinensis TaxID=3198878 RepID=UPI0031593D3E